MPITSAIHVIISHILPGFLLKKMQRESCAATATVAAVVQEKKTDFLYKVIIMYAKCVQCSSKANKKYAKDRSI